MTLHDIHAHTHISEPAQLAKLSPGSLEVLVLAGCVASALHKFHRRLAGVSGGIDYASQAFSQFVFPPCSR